MYNVVLIVGGGLWRSLAWALSMSNVLSEDWWTRLLYLIGCHINHKICNSLLYLFSNIKAYLLKFFYNNECIVFWKGRQWWMIDTQTDILSIECFRWRMIVWYKYTYYLLLNLWNCLLKTFNEFNSRQFLVWIYSMYMGYILKRLKIHY